MLSNHLNVLTVGISLVLIKRKYKIRTHLAFITCSNERDNVCERKTKVWILQPKQFAVFFQNKRGRSGFEGASENKLIFFSVIYECLFPNGQRTRLHPLGNQTGR